MQKEGNVEGKCNVGSPFSKAAMQRVMIKYGLCMQNRDNVGDNVQSRQSYQNEVNVKGKYNVGWSCNKEVMQGVMKKYRLCMLNGVG